MQRDLLTTTKEKDFLIKFTVVRREENGNREWIHEMYANRVGDEGRNMKGKLSRTNRQAGCRAGSL